MLNIVLPTTALTLTLILLQPRLRHSPLWRATMTPLASIIGSGFLISGPLLTHIAGTLAPLAMAAILLTAFAIGAVIRFNIRYAEPSFPNAATPLTLKNLQRLSDLALAVAYIVSVAFYVRLLASFVLRMFQWRDALYENLLTTIVLLFIAGVGWVHGLRGLEKAEGLAVVIKLGIIAALLLGLVSFDYYWFQGQGPMTPHIGGMSLVERLRLLAGLLLIVQGFETSRYLGDAYDADTRVRSMRNAQLLAGAIYLGFILLGLPLLMEFHGEADETAIISLAERVAVVLPGMIVLAAVMSQFSAAVADTAGAGGLFRELSGNRMSSHLGYVMLVVIAIALVWTANVFEIVALASRVFAFYYLSQCLVAIVVCWRLPAGAGGQYHGRLAGFVALAILLCGVVVFARPVG